MNTLLGFQVFLSVLVNLILLSTTTNGNPNFFNGLKPPGRQIARPKREQPSQALSRKLPQAIIIGAKKCGTRALLKFIGTHENVSAAGAEVHFFDRHYDKGYEWYRSRMPVSNEHQITMEKTPKYFVDGETPQRVYEMNPSMKLIVVLRDPVTRAISEYVQAQLKKQRSQQQDRDKRRRMNATRLTNSSSSSSSASDNESEHFRQMLYVARGRHRDRNGQPVIRAGWPVVRNGIYHRHLMQWLQFFPLEQFLFVNGEQLIKEPSVELLKVQHFLGLAPIIQKRHFIHNKRKGFACIYKPLKSRNVKCLSDQKGRIHPQIDEDILDDLRSFYRPYNKMLFNLLNQKPWWLI